MTAESPVPTEHPRIFTPEQQLVQVANIMVGITNPRQPRKISGVENGKRLDTGFNCSGFVRYALDAVYDLPAAEYTNKDGSLAHRKPRYMRELLDNPFVPVPWDKRKPGHLIFFVEEPQGDLFKADHCGVLLDLDVDNLGTFIHSPGIVPSCEIEIQSVYQQVGSFSRMPITDPTKHIMIRSVPAEFLKP